MTRILYGDRISKGAELRMVSCAVIFDEARQKFLLTQRTDNGLWCLPAANGIGGNA